MPCRDTGHHFSALGCGQATKIVMRRGGGPELCVDEVSGVENRQVVSPLRTSVWLGRSPHPIRQGSVPQSSHRASVQPSESPYSHPAGGSPARAPRHWRGDPHPTWQGSHPAGSIAQGSHRASVQPSRSVCPLPPGRGLPRRTNVQPSRSAGCQRASLPGRQLVGR